MEFTKTLLAFGLAAAASASAAQYEAEDGTLTKDAAVASNTEASGGKYVKMNGGDITFPAVTVEKAGQYSVVVHYMNNYGGDKINYVGVGSTTSQVSFPVTDKGKFVDVETVLTLAAGANTIAITNSWGWIDVDYIEVKEFEAKAFTLCNAPVTKNATPSAIKLYNFLVNNFGKGELKDISDPNALHEANLLMLNIDKAKTRLGWKPTLNSKQTMALVADWYKRYQKEDVYEICIDEIEQFVNS